jgi:outer membrane lipoprotein SlyB
MSNLVNLADEQAQSISGGWSFTSFSFAKASGVYTSLDQSNTVNNLGLGLLAGFGGAQSLQGNGSSIATVLG